MGGPFFYAQAEVRKFPFLQKNFPNVLGELLFVQDFFLVWTPFSKA